MGVFVGFGVFVGAGVFVDVGEKVEAGKGLSVGCGVAVAGPDGQGDLADGASSDGGVGRLG